MTKQARRILARMEDSAKMLLKHAAPISEEDHASVEDLEDLEDVEEIPHVPEDHEKRRSRDISSDQAKDQALSKELQHLSKIMMELLNEDDPLSKPYARKYLATTYKSEASIAEVPGLKAVSSKSHFTNVAEYRKENPNYHIEVYNTTAHVNRDTGRAMVWVTLRVRGLPGLPDGASRESVTAIHWKKQAGGLWVLFRTTGLRGPGDYT